MSLYLLDFMFALNRVNLYIDTQMLQNVKKKLTFAKLKVTYDQLSLYVFFAWQPVRIFLLMYVLQNVRKK